MKKIILQFQLTDQFKYQQKFRSQKVTVKIKVKKVEKMIKMIKEKTMKIKLNGFSLNKKFC